MAAQRKRTPAVQTPASREYLAKNTSVEKSEHTQAEAFGQRRQGRPLHISYSVAAAVAGIAARGVQ